MATPATETTLEKVLAELADLRREVARLDVAVMDLRSRLADRPPREQRFPFGARASHWKPPRILPPDVAAMPQAENVIEERPATLPADRIAGTGTSPDTTVVGPIGSRFVIPTRGLFPRGATVLRDRVVSLARAGLGAASSIVLPGPRTWLTWIAGTRFQLMFAYLAVAGFVWERFLVEDYSWSIMAIWAICTGAVLMLIGGLPAWEFRLGRTEGILLAITLAIGAALRLYHVDDIPFGLNNDAAYSGLIALKAAHSGSYIAWSPDPNAGETFFDYWIVLFMAVFGPVSVAIRGAAAAAGILTLVGMYLLSRQLLGIRMAVIATFLLATSGWHLVFSRVGWRVITLPLIETFAFYFLFLAFRTRRRGYFALAGALLALLLDTYLAARVLPVLAAVWALVELIRGPGRADLLRGYALALGCFLLAGAPVLSVALNRNGDFNARFDGVGVLAQFEAGNLHLLWQNLRATLGLFTSRGNGDDFFLDQPLLDLPARWLFVPGLAIAAWKVIRGCESYRFVALGLVMALLPGMVSIAPNGNRAAGAMPFVYIIAALPLVALADLPALALRLRPRVNRELPKALATIVPRSWWPRAATPANCVAAIVLAYSVVSVFTQYLGPNRTNVPGFHVESAALARYINHISNRYDVYVSGTVYGYDTLSYLTYRPGEPMPPLTTGIDPSHWSSEHYTYQADPMMFFQDSPRSGRGIAFVLHPWLLWNKTNQAIPPTLLRMYPGALSFMLTYRDGPTTGPAALVVLVPPLGRNARSDVPANSTPPPP